MIRVFLLLMTGMAGLLVGFSTTVQADDMSPVFANLRIRLLDSIGHSRHDPPYRQLPIYQRDELLDDAPAAPAATTAKPY
jgi:hypothetical protein